MYPCKCTLVCVFTGKPGVNLGWHSSGAICLVLSSRVSHWDLGLADWARQVELRDLLSHPPFSSPGNEAPATAPRVLYGS